APATTVGRRFEAQVAVGGHALAVLDHGDAGLVAVRIDVGEHRDIEARRLEIALVVELEAIARVGLQRDAGTDGKRENTTMTHGLPSPGSGLSGCRPGEDSDIAGPRPAAAG